MKASEWFEQGTLSFEWAKAAPTLLFTVVVGLVAAYIALNQWRVAKAKLNLDLFQKRYEVFLATHRVLSKHLTVPAQGQPDDTIADQLPQAGFFFGPEVQEYMVEVIGKELELWFYYKNRELSQDEPTLEQAARVEELELWFAVECMENCSNIFGPYLDFKNWR